MIADNVRSVLSRIEQAREAFDGAAVKLVAVTKNHTVEEIQKLYDAGLRDFGENRVQEFLEKYDKLPEDINWHIIGTLQRNKVKYIIGKVALIQSVDTLELLGEISRQAEKNEVTASVLLQINTAKEESKHGFYEEDIFLALEAAAKLENIRVKGLMMIAPNLEDQEELAAVFAKTEKIYREVMKYAAKYDNICIDTLSMGMSNDFTLAIKYASNMVRVGRALFA